MKRQFIIEVEENKAETVVNLLAQISVKVSKPAEEKKRYVKILSGNYENDSFLCLTEEQFSVLHWLSDNDYYGEWEEVDPEEMFEEI